MRRGAPFVEELIIDLHSRTLRSRASNLFLRKLVHIELKNTYTAIKCPDSNCEWYELLSDELCFLIYHSTEHKKEASASGITFGFNLDTEKVLYRWFKSRSDSVVRLLSSGELHSSEIRCPQYGRCN